MNEAENEREKVKSIFSILMVAMVGVVAYFFKAYSDIGSTAESIYNEVSVVEMREESISRDDSAADFVLVAGS